MADTLPADLARAPQLRRLLTPDERLLYTVRFHVLRGWGVLLAALVCLAASYWFLPAAVPGFALLGFWYLPHLTNEVAVTDDRLLLRVGWLRMVLEAVDDEKLVRWELSQGVISSLMNAGSVTLRIREAASTREIVLPWVAEPVTFLEALQAMQDEKYRDNQATV
ncbi:MAG: hypothetical protein EON60_02825 [Alphaproteobacteria bacterium]|nr:MAG: hypothetical protein EON60_02825 [Alphaproteobacteria bacterium]